jgi:S1-C subfamily serine protease
LARIAQLGQAVLEDLHAAPPVEFESVAMSSSQMAAGRGFSVTLGTIPDYADEGEGVQLSGVREGSPAQRAGILGDDVIVGLAGESIGDLYDYTAILGELEVGGTVDITVLRAGERLTLSITPAAR